MVSDKILIFSLYVGCFYHKGPALNISFHWFHSMDHVLVAVLSPHQWSFVIRSVLNLSFEAI